MTLVQHRSHFSFSRKSSLPPHLPVLARRHPGGLFKGAVIAADARVADDLADLFDALGRQLQERLANRHPGLRLQLAESLVKKLPDQAWQIFRLIAEVGGHFFQSHVLNISHQIVHDHPRPGHRISIVDIEGGREWLRGHHHGWQRRRISWKIVYPGW